MKDKNNQADLPGFKEKDKFPRPTLIIILIIGAALAAYYAYHNIYGKQKDFPFPPLQGIPLDKIAPRQGFYAPNFTLNDLNGKKVTFSDYRGKVLFINIWATWCPTCREEMPSMQKLYEKFQDHEFEILAINIDTDGAKSVDPFMKQYALTFPALLDPDSRVARLYMITGVPESFIVNKKGLIVRKIIGPLDWSSETSFSFFSRLIKENP